MNVSSSRHALILSGHVDTKEDSERAAAVAGAYAKSVINAITFGVSGEEQVLLEVKFAEIDRAKLLQAGLNLFSQGAGKVIGSTSTQQFGTFGAQQITDAFGKGISNSAPFVSTQQISDPLNIFLFRPDLHLGAVLKALQEKNVLQVLAEPNLVALNGKEASFLAGGEFPIPIAQGGVGQGLAVTIFFKEYGVKLKFTPIITPAGDIRLHVAPEVSALDFSTGVTLNGFTVPGLTSRKAETEVLMRDGQSFVMAGLMDNRLRDNMSKVPGIGNVPVLGNIFKSKDYLNSTTELMVLVTAHKVLPQDKQPETPAFPKKFLDNKGFDAGHEGR
ncbi:MAG: hypothetical protein JOZ43_06145 [Acidobacteriales bacterium]|nr:hypothetical protein [Terriglobales bacterium]